MKTLLPVLTPWMASVVRSWANVPMPPGGCGSETWVGYPTGDLVFILDVSLKAFSSSFLNPSLAEWNKALATIKESTPLFRWLLWSTEWNDPFHTREVVAEMDDPFQTSWASEAKMFDPFQMLEISADARDDPFQAWELVFAEWDDPFQTWEVEATELDDPFPTWELLPAELDDVVLWTRNAAQLDVTSQLRVFSFRIWNGRNSGAFGSNDFRSWINGHCRPSSHNPSMWYLRTRYRS